MVNLQSTRTTSRAALALLILASSLVGCAQRGSYPTAASTDASGSSVPPWARPNEQSPDPYHYRCTGACLLAGGGP